MKAPSQRAFHHVSDPTLDIASVLQLQEVVASAALGVFTLNTAWTSIAA